MSSANRTLQIALVAAFLVVAALVLVPAPAEAASPHGTYSVSAATCDICHTPHDAEGELLAPATGSGSTQAAICYSCHDGTGASADVLNSADSFSRMSGHTLEEAEDSRDADLTNRCSSCHSPHADPERNPKLRRESINGTTVAGNGNEWCLACHDDRDSWAATGYPDTSSPRRDASGYPTLGAFPGRSTYLDPARNAHSQLATEVAGQERGDCRLCHASHRGGNRYDALRLTYRPSTTETVAEDRAQGTYAESCFACHDGNAERATRGAADIRSMVTSSSAEAAAGHRVKTSGGTLPARSPLPCYECHNPHGSKYGNRSLISDERGRGVETSSAAGVRSFCLSCHSTRDGKVWDSTSRTYAAVSATETVAGLRRDGTLAPGQEAPGDGYSHNLLKLGGTSAGHDSSSARSCYECHGNDYSSAGGANVHNPASGASTGGKDCYSCHTGYRQFMEDGAGDKTGANRTDAYHHVLGGEAGDGDFSPDDGDAPTSRQDVYCVSCHVDHDSFNGERAANLRADATASDGATASADYLPDGSNGVCVSCHSTSLAKDADDRKADESTATPRILGGTGEGAFGASAHSYEATSAFSDGSEFRANCAKCHNDERAEQFQTSSMTFGTHWSPSERLLSALGAEATPAGEEEACYRCHSRPGDAIGGVGKPAAGRDWYGIASMSTAAEDVFRQFQSASRHPVGGSPNGRVECSNCHNTHSVNASSPVSDPDNTYAAAPYATPADRTQFCMKCHDGGTLPTTVTSDGVFVPSTVSIAPGIAGSMNKSMFASRSHWTANGSISGDETSDCSVCHDEHASSAPKLLGQYDPISGTNRVGGTTITANDNSLCFACHTRGSEAAESRDASGYPVEGRFPGLETFASGIHSGPNVVRPGALYPGGDCKNCHDPHGTANPYDQLTGQYTSERFDSCFDCHDGSPSTRDVKAFYPVAAGGSSEATGAVGHATKTAGTLPAGSALPCYDCHNAHGSPSASGLTVTAQVTATERVRVGDSAGEIDLSSAKGVRDFCFACHTTADGANGYDGAGMREVAEGATVEGIDRVSTSASLRLPDRYGHRDADTTSCYDCHGNSYAAGGNNVHSPKMLD